MLQLTPQSRICLAVEPIDFRAGIDRLAALCRERLAQNPLGSESPSEGSVVKNISE